LVYCHRNPYTDGRAHLVEPLGLSDGAQVWAIDKIISKGVGMAIDD
jgi:hypothetical protein